MRALLILILSGMPALADEASRMAKAEEMFRLTNAETNIRRMLDTMSTQIKSTVSRMMPAGMTAEQEKTLNKTQDQVNRLLVEAMSWEKLKPDFVKLAAEIYSEEELDGLIAFYKTPAGKALIAKTPQLMAKSVEISQKQVMELQPQILKIIQETTAAK